MEPDKMISVCGTICTECDYFKKKECRGCNIVLGKVWWSGYVDASSCPVYNCVTTIKRIENCGLCLELPCTLWYNLKDPNVTTEQHNRSIVDRVKRLKKDPR